MKRGIAMDSGGFFAAVLALVFAGNSQALPVSVGGGLFFQNAGAAPEVFFQKAAIWLPAADIPGKWTEVSKNTVIWKTPETAFGLMSDMISLRRDDDGKLTEVILTYSTSTTGKTSAALHDTLHRLLSTTDGEPDRNEDGSLFFESGMLRIALPPIAEPTLNLSITRIAVVEKEDASTLPGWLVPGDLGTPATWDSPEFRAPWQFPRGNTTTLARANHPDPPPLCGMPVKLAGAVVSNGDIRSLSLVILDAGMHFGYARTSAGITRDSAAEFDRIFIDALTSATGALSGLTGAPGKEAVPGRRNGIGLPSVIFSGNGIHARLIAMPRQSIVLEFFRSAGDTTELFSEIPATKDTEPLFPDDIGTGTMPMIPQGDRAYCGPAALAMIGHHIGLNLGTESIAGLAGYAYGSSENGDIRKLASLMAREAGLKASRSGRFDPKKAAESFSEGLPVLVFRRWCAERDFIHQTIATRLAEGDLTATLPEPGFSDAESWPDKSAPAHASVIHGYNPVRKEVIFTETWGARSAGKRMRIEELEETAYYAVYFRP